MNWTIIPHRLIFHLRHPSQVVLAGEAQNTSLIDTIIPFALSCRARALFHRHPDPAAAVCRSGHAKGRGFYPVDWGFTPKGQSPHLRLLSLKTDPSEIAKNSEPASYCSPSELSD